MITSPSRQAGGLGGPRRDPEDQRALVALQAAFGLDGGGDRDQLQVLEHGDLVRR